MEPTPSANRQPAREPSVSQASASSPGRGPGRKARLGAGLLLGLGLALGTTGCARHVHVHHHDDARLEREHADKTVIIVHERPGPHRVCWRHRNHWHCRR